MEQDIDKIINDLEMALLTDLYGHITTLVKKEDLEHLIKAYKELEEKWDKDTHKLQNALDMANADKINNYIPVSLVEEIKNELHDNYINSNGDNFLKLEHQLEILEKLLEKRK